MISIIRLLAQENREKTWDNFLDNLGFLKANIEGKGQLLYLTQRARHQDISLFVHVTDPNVIGDFISRDLSKIKDITSIWAIHLMKPLFFPLPKDTKDKIRFSITAKVFPANLDEVYQSLVKESPLNDIQMAYIAFTMHLFEESIIFSLLADDEESIKKHLRQNINNMTGILNTTAYRIAKTKPLISYEAWKNYATQHSIIPSWDVHSMIEGFQIQL